MPKIVNQEERKQKIAIATWNVMKEKGLEHVSVRAIAEEAGLSLGALRHYFSSQEELLTYAMKLVKERVTTRVEKMIQAPNMTLEERSLRVLLELLPITEESTLEMTVWFHFMSSRYFKQSALAVEDDNILVGIEKIVGVLESAGSLKSDLDLEVEIEKLYALIDGLALHALFKPKRLTKQKVVQTLVHHLNTILQLPIQVEKLNIE